MIRCGGGELGVLGIVVEEEMGCCDLSMLLLLLGLSRLHLLS